GRPHIGQTRPPKQPHQPQGNRNTHPDRLALVTCHRRAPAGRPSAGVRADGSSGPRVRLYGREDPRGARAPRSLPGRPLCSVTEKPRLPQVSDDGARRGVGGSHGQNLPAHRWRRQLRQTPKFLKP
ncbi:hypothetical protein ABVT39_007333, partial [Epinephelus coioides]